MRKAYWIFIFISIFAYAYSQRKPKVSKAPKMVTESYYHFEDVNWQKMPERIFEEHDDCIGHFIRCVRSVTILQWVCGFDTRTSYFEDYYSSCEIEVENCRYRMYWNKNNKFGNPFYDHKFFENRDAVILNGEGKSCAHYWHDIQNYDFRRIPGTVENQKIYFGDMYPAIKRRISFLTNINGQNNNFNSYRLRGNYGYNNNYHYPNNDNDYSKNSNEYNNMHKIDYNNNNYDYNNNVVYNNKNRYNSMTDQSNNNYYNPNNVPYYNNYININNNTNANVLP